MADGYLEKRAEDFERRRARLDNKKKREWRKALKKYRLSRLESQNNVTGGR